MDIALLSGSGIAHQRLGDFFFGMGGETASVQEDARALYAQAQASALMFKGSARSNEFVASNALCCWRNFSQGIRYQARPNALRAPQGGPRAPRPQGQSASPARGHLQHRALRDAALCRLGARPRGTRGGCASAKGLVVPSIDGLAQDLDLPELLLLHELWADWCVTSAPTAPSSISAPFGTGISPLALLSHPTLNRIGTVCCQVLLAPHTGGVASASAVSSAPAHHRPASSHPRLCLFPHVRAP